MAAGYGSVGTVEAMIDPRRVVAWSASMLWIVVVDEWGAACYLRLC